MHFCRHHFLFQRFCSLSLPLSYTSVIRLGPGQLRIVYLRLQFARFSQTRKKGRDAACCLSDDFHCRDTLRYVP